MTTLWEPGKGTPLAGHVRETADGWRCETVRLKADPEHVSLWGDVRGALGADGRYLALFVGREIDVFDTHSGERAGNVAAEADHLCFAGSCRLIAWRRGADTIRTYVVPSLRPESALSLAPAEDAVESLAPSPDGRALLVGTRRGVVLEFELTGDVVFRRAARRQPS